MTLYSCRRATLLVSLALLLSACAKDKPAETSGTIEPEAEAPPASDGPAPVADESEPSATEEAGPEEAEEPLAESSAPPPAASSSAEGIEGATVDENGLYTSASGRRQSVDSYGSPLFDTEGMPIWEPLPAERARQLFEEAMVLRKGVAGGEPDLMGAAMRLNEALSLVPELVEARYNLALVQLQQDLLKEAVQSLKKVLAERPDWAEAQLSLAIAHERAGNFAAATMAYTNGLQDGKDSVDMLNGLARIYRKQGKAELAVEKTKAILKIDSNSIDAYNTLGLAYLDMGELELARFVFLKAEKSVPGADENSALQANLGLVNYRFESWSKDKREFEATDRFERALELNSSDLGAMVNLAHLKLINFDFEGARELLERAHRKMPANVPIQLNLAVARRGTGEYDGAEKLYNQIASAPGEYRADALVNLAILQGDFRKDYKTAIETYNEYISVVEGDGGTVAEDDPVRGYIRSIEKILARAEKKRQRAADKAVREAQRAERAKVKAAAAEVAAAETAVAEAAEAEAAEAAEAEATAAEATAAEAAEAEATAAEATSAEATSAEATTPGVAAEGAVDEEAPAGAEGQGTEQVEPAPEAELVGETSEEASPSPDAGPVDEAPSDAGAEEPTAEEVQ